MKDQRSLTVRLLEERIQDLKAEISCYSFKDPYLRIARRELRVLETKFKHQKGKL